MNREVQAGRAALSGAPTAMRSATVTEMAALT